MKTGKNRFWALLILDIILWNLWDDRLEYLFRGTRGIRLLWNFDRTGLFMASVWVILVAWTLLAFIRMLKSRPAGRKSSSVKADPVGSRPAETGRKRKPAEEEEALHCEHLTGRAKYMQQLEGYLRSGLIDRAEYKVLKEKYMKMEIPEDYH